MITHHSTSRPLRRVLGAAAGLSLLAAACGGDDDDDASASDDTTAEETADTTADSDDTVAEETAEETADTTADSSASGDGDDAGSDEVFRVAVVAPSTANDLSWTQALSDGLLALEESQNLEIAFSESLFVVEDAGVAMRDYAEEGYDLIIAHGTQYAGSIQELAPEFPDQSFAYGTATDTFDMPNVYAYTAAAEEGGYVNGVMAAAIADGGPIGVVGPLEAGDAKLYVDGFLQGAEEGGSTDVTATYTGSFSDVALASEAAETFVANGAEVLTGTSQSVVGAVGVAAENDIPFFATQSDGTQMAPELIVASHVYKFDVIFDEMISAIKDGTLGGESKELSYANGGFILVFNDGYPLDAEVVTLGEDTVAAIIAGDIDPEVATG